MAVFERIVWVVLDSVGIGELPDAADYGDVGRNTLGHIAESRPLRLPNLACIGLANIAPARAPAACCRPARRIRQRRHTLAGKRYDHWTLGNGRNLARSGFSGLPSRIPP